MSIYRRSRFTILLVRTMGINQLVSINIPPFYRLTDDTRTQGIIPHTYDQDADQRLLGRETPGIHDTYSEPQLEKKNIITCRAHISMRYSGLVFVEYIQQPSQILLHR